MPESPPFRYPESSLSGLRRIPAAPKAFLEGLARSGDLVPFTLAHSRAVLLNRAEDVHAVLTDPGAFRKGRAAVRARRLLGTGLLTADDTLNRERRRLLQPAFARARLDDCAGFIVRRARKAVGAWRHGEVVDLTRVLGALTFGVVGEAIAGVEVDSAFDAVRAAVSEATDSLDPLVSLVAPGARLRRAERRLRTIVGGLAAAGSERGSVGALVALMRAHGDSDPEQSADDLLTVLLAGYDTLTSALSFTWALLSEHPQDEAAVRAELDRVLGGRAPAAADLPRLVYTRAVFSEALRLYPPAWVLARESVTARQLAAGVIEPGTIVIMSQHLLHRDARYFDRPEQFDPSRWTSGAVPSRGAYLPFGAGPRACIGESLAWMEGVLLLAVIVQRWRLELEGGFPDIAARITQRPRLPVLMRLNRAG